MEATMQKVGLTPRGRRLRRPPAALGLLIVIVSVILSSASLPAVANSMASHAMASYVAQVTPSVDIQLFASEVETLGAYHFADSFAGAVLTPAGVTEVYALPGSDGSLIRAIGAINPAGYPVEVLAARRSYNQLNALSARLIAVANGLKARGVTLTRSDPDPSTGSILVSLAAPTTSAIAALSAVPAVQERIGASMTAFNYIAGVSALLSRELGPGFTVESQYTGTAIAADRFTDGAPFYGGDSIIGLNHRIACTGGFFVKGNRSGHSFLLTAGHCSTDDWDMANGTGIGPTSKNYWVPGSTNDFQTIYVPGGGLPYVWGNGTAIHRVAAWLLPAIGVQITFDGAKTGEVPHSRVTAVNATDFNIFDSNSGRTYDVYPVVQAAPPPGTVTCQRSDSGGPVYLRTSGSPVDAIGTIAAFFGGPGITILCTAQQIGSEMAASNTTLMTAP